MSDAGPRTDAERALARALALHGAEVARLAGRILGDAEAARDVAQEAFVRLHERQDEVEDAGPWLRAVAARLALDRLRRRRREARALPLAVAPAARAPAARAASPRDPAEAAEERAALVDALAGLPGRQREVVVLRVLQGETFPDLARALGISEGSAKTHLRRGLERLRRVLAPFVGAGEEAP